MKFRLSIFLVFIVSAFLFSEVKVDVVPIGKKQNSGIYVKKGDSLKITVEGKWSLWDKYKLVGGEGHPVNAGELGNWGALLGKIGSGKIFYIGQGIDLVSNEEGILYLFPNKGKYLIEKASGNLQVTIDGGKKIDDFITELSSKSTKFTFDPQNGVLQTGLYFEAGSDIEIYAIGKWTMWDGIYQETNAEGHEFEFTADGIPWGKLFGGIGSSTGQFIDTFSIGDKTVTKASKSGILSFYPFIGNYVSVKNGKMDIYVLGGKKATEDNIKTADSEVKAQFQKIALDKLNSYRKALALPELQINENLSNSALEHAKYLVLNNTFEREEEQGKLNFTAATFEDRLVKFGYEGKAKEMFCLIDSTEGAVDLFIDTIYHRLKLMDPELKYLGYGSYKQGEKTIHVFDFGYAKDGEINAAWEKLVYPLENANDVKIEWSGLENPDPLPQGTVKPLGYPISILLKDQITKVLDAKLLDSKGETVDSFIISPENDINNKQLNAVIIIPKKILTNDTQYTVNIKVTVGAANTEKNYSWNYKTVK